MKKNTTQCMVSAIALVLASVANGNAQCISGNCFDGYGVYQNEKYRYTGFFEDGLPNGHGTLYFNASGDIYTGEFKDGQRTRQGSYMYAEDGLRYIGFWKDNKQHGPIDEIEPSGKSYHDIYDEGKPLDPGAAKGTVYGSSKNGYNVTIYEDGSQYVGYNRDNKHNGWGTLTKFDGSLYTGEFKDDMFNGYGTLTNPDGSTTEGVWENNRFVGELKNQIGCVSGDCKDSYSVFVKNGEKYIGEFKNGVPHGMGKYILPDGSSYTGSVVAGKIDGYGSLTYADTVTANAPHKYVGDLKNGKPNGYGAMFYNNGDLYYGHFTDNVYDGQGVYLDKATGKKKSGFYLKGELVKEIAEQDFDLIYGDKEKFGIKLTEGGRYMGYLIDGAPEGQGSLETYDGMTIIGEFQMGMANGLAMCENRGIGSKYVGQIRDNKMTGSGTMYYANGTKIKGLFRDGQLTRETAESSSATKPEVSWTAPSTFNIEVTEGSFTVKLCVRSAVPVDEVAIYDNNICKVNTPTRGYKKKNSDLCDYAFEFDIQLEPGRNELKAVVKNAGGSTVSESRYVSWVESDAISNQKRIALIIGNGAYQNIGRLPNPANDARLMASVLKGLGFETMEYTDIDRNQMKEAVYDFGDKLRENKAVGLFFYAGHGIQVDGVNYLVPVNAKLARREEVEDVCFSIDKVLGQLAYAANDLNIIILDACRDDPFAATSRAIKGDGGLAQINAPKGTFIAYSTAPGKTAADGTGSNGLYTEQLAKAMKTPGNKIEDVFKQVRNEVYRISHQAVEQGVMAEEQIPWENSSVFGDFYFIR
ncbi:MAG: caspase family protein [Bacteroidales bacterium]|nr:caspase family protein [Bacteroidales bacterium]